MKRIVITVHGYVQGVFFRYTTRNLARKLGLTGYVMNQPDGTVFIVAEGPEDKLEELLAFCRKGPRDAVVERVDFNYTDADNSYKGFNYGFEM